MIQMKPSSAHATTQATSTASFRNDEIDPRPVARISIDDLGSNPTLPRNSAANTPASPGPAACPYLSLPGASLSGGMDSDHIEKQYARPPLGHPDERTQLPMSAPSRKLPPGRLIAATHNPGKVKELRRPPGRRRVHGRFGRRAGPARAGGDRRHASRAMPSSRRWPQRRRRASRRWRMIPAWPAMASRARRASIRRAGPVRARISAPPCRRSRTGSRPRPSADGEVDKRASFVCVLSLAWPDGHVESFEGVVRGQLVFPAAR